MSILNKGFPEMSYVVLLLLPVIRQHKCDGYNISGFMLHYDGKHTLDGFDPGIKLDIVKRKGIQNLSNER